MMMTWHSIMPLKVPLMPTSVRNRRNAMPSTTVGTIRGDMNSACRASRPWKLPRPMASAAGTASTVASVAENSASFRLIQAAVMKSGLSRIALNQRSEMPLGGNSR